MDGAPGLHGTFVHPESSSLPSLRLQAQWRMSVDGAGSIGSTYTYESESSLTVTNSYAHRRSSTWSQQRLNVFSYASVAVENASPPNHLLRSVVSLESSISNNFLARNGATDGKLFRVVRSLSR